MIRSIPALRNDQRLDLCRLDTLCAKLNATRATAREALTNAQNSRVGNAMDDIKMLLADIEVERGLIMAGSDAIKAIEDAARKEAEAQRQAEIDHSDLLSTMRQIVLGHRPSLFLVD